MSRVDHAEASSKFIEAKDHADFHDKRLWDLRKKRDVESEAMPEWEQLRSLASAIKEHTLTHLGDYLERVRAQRDRQRHGRALGPRRRRAQPDRLRDPRVARRHDARQEQVDADRRVRDAAVSREPRHRDRRDRSRRAHPAARRRAAEPHRRAGGAQAARRRRRGVRPHARHRPEEHRRAVSRREPARAHPAVLPEGAGRHDRRQLRDRRDRQLRRLHQRGQRRPRRQPAEPAHRVDRHREAAAEDRAPRRLRADAVAQRARARRSRRSRRTSARRGPAPRCMSCWSTTGARNASAWRTSGIR